MADLKKLLETKRAVIDECCTQLATNYNVPASRIIGAYCYKLGIRESDWDKLVALRNGW